MHLHQGQQSAESKLEAISQGAFEATNDYITMKQQELRANESRAQA